MHSWYFSRSIFFSSFGKSTRLLDFARGRLKNVSPLDALFQTTSGSGEAGGNFDGTEIFLVMGSLEPALIFLVVVGVVGSGDIE